MGFNSAFKGLKAFRRLHTSLLILLSFLYVTDTAYFEVMPTLALILACFA